MFRTILTVLAMGVVLGVSGCASTRERVAAEIPQPTADEALVIHIDQRLRNDPVTSRLRLGVQSVDGIVTLSGRIDESAVRMRAVNLVRGTPGVRGVIDNTMDF